MRELVLCALARLFPFDMRGDCRVPPATGVITVSCVINFYGRLDLLSAILHCLAEQKYPRERFEVVLVEDRGGTKGGRELAERFADRLIVVYMPLEDHFGKMGYSRNAGLTRSRGEIILFLDDDTIIMQPDFLCRLEKLFDEHKTADAIIPHGSASYSVVKGRYAYHDPYFMTSRCCAYRRSVLTELGGFMAHFIGQEDVEFVIRFKLAGKKSISIPELKYRHPPLLVPNFRKPQAVGSSFYGLKSRYPLLIWLLAVLNCGRHAPLYLLPGRRCREMGRFGVGFLLGVTMAPFKKEGYRYG